MNADGGIGGRIALYRRRRGLSQKVLAELLGRSESWLSQVERGILPLENLSVVLRLAEVLKVDPPVLIGSPLRLAPNGGVHLEEVEMLRQAINSYGSSYGAMLPPGDASELPSLQALATDVGAAWVVRHASRYTDLARLMPALLRRAEMASQVYDGEDRIRAYGLLADVYQLLRALLRKVGETQYAWIAGDRAMQAARLAGLPVAIAKGARALAMVFTAQGRIEDAENVVAAALRGLESEVTRAGERGWSAWGALMLQGSVIAARKVDRGGLREYLREADRAVTRLGPGWLDPETGFGVANVAIHRVSTSVELGDAGEAIQAANKLDLSTLPEKYSERRASFLIDVARAYGQRKNKGAAVLHLLEAEQVADQEVRYNVLVQEMVRSFLKREGTLRTPGLWPLAHRLGVVE